MTDGLKTVLFPVTDLGKAKGIFTALLGTEPIVDQPWYVGYNVAGQDIGLDPNGHARGMTGPVASWNVVDIRATLASLESAGATVLADVNDVAGGKLVASVTDADGNGIGLIQPA